eukprot:4670805-Pleurochrysis_carterae.AAC.2
MRGLYPSLDRLSRQFVKMKKHEPAVRHSHNDSAVSICVDGEGIRDNEYALSISADLPLPYSIRLHAFAPHSLLLHLPFSRPFLPYTSIASGPPQNAGRKGCALHKTMLRQRREIVLTKLVRESRKVSELKLEIASQAYALRAASRHLRPQKKRVATMQLSSAHKLPRYLEESLSNTNIGVQSGGITKAQRTEDDADSIESARPH